MDLPLFELAARRSSLFDEHEPRQRPEVRNEDGKRAEMLARLRTGPLSTYDAERLVHRGQAVIGALRDDGHKIELEKVNGLDHYVYYGPGHRRVRISKSLQEAYYQGAHWRETALARKRVDAFTCQQCGASDELETHHWRYQLFAESVEHDLITLCRTCHGNIHDAISGSSVHFPRTVTEDIVRRIEAGE